MSFYVVLLLSQVGLVFFGRATGFKNNVTLLTLLIFITSLIAGLRGNVGTDTFSYKNYYESVDSGGDVVFEPTFMWLANFGNWCGFSSQFLIFSVSCIQGIFVWLIMRKVQEKDFFFLYFISSCFVYLNLNLIRAGLAVYVAGYALLLLGRWRFFGFCAAVLTHASMLVLVPLYVKRLKWLILVIVSLLIFYQDQAVQKYSAYVENQNLFLEDASIGFGYLFFSVLIIFIYVISNLGAGRKFGLLFSCALLMRFLSNGMPILDRFAVLYEFLFFVMLFHYADIGRSRSAILGLIFFGAYRSLMFVAGSDLAMEELIYDSPGMAELYGETHWIPYEYFWN